MRWSFYLCKIGGIPIRVHYIFPLMLLFFLLAQTIENDLVSGLLFLAKLIILFILVLIHELAHSLVARRHGIKVVDIILWPLGGIARLAGIIRDPIVELKVAAAGPGINLLLGLLMIPFIYSSALSSIRLREISIGHLAAWFCLLNLLIGTFNLFPAFPMDGGRILRSLLAFRSTFLKATATAVKVGRFLAILMALSGIVLGILPATKEMGFSFSLFIIAIFIYFTGKEEEKRVRLEYYRENFASGGREFIFPDGKQPEGFPGASGGPHSIYKDLMRLFWNMRRKN